MGLNAQTIGYQAISETNVDLTEETTLGEVTINPSTSGKVIVRFDGKCTSDVGDRIVLAASNSTSWGTNDGCATVKAVSEDFNRNSFSHSRVYDVDAGSHTFYAVAQNYVDTDGSGVASIYATLTVEFIPDGTTSIVGFEGISVPSVDFADNTTVGEVTIDPTTSGKVIVHFDGTCISDVGDRIVLAASNTTSWGTNDGSVSVEAYSAANNRNTFSHTRVYDVEAGSHTFYAVARNYVETDGSGIASIYGSLTVEFVPEGQILVDFEGIASTNVELSDPTIVGSVRIAPTSSGKAVVHFDGKCITDEGDRIVLAASNTGSWGANDGSVSAEAIDGDVDQSSFSHTRVYEVSEGDQVFNAIAQNYVETDGSGIASIYGSLVVKFVPDVFTSINNDLFNESLNIYPSPANNKFFIEFEEYKNSKLEILNSNGQLLKTIDLNNSKTQVEIGDLSKGMYIIKVVNKNGTFTRKIVKE